MDLVFVRSRETIVPVFMYANFIIDDGRKINEWIVKGRIDSMHTSYWLVNVIYVNVIHVHLCSQEDTCDDRCCL